MSPAPYTAEPGHWFLRGVQSAVFYYISCTPWVEYKHKRKRRREAQESAQEKGEIVVTQPGIVRQPGPFQTNEAWAEELMLGPGPPKGWKKDTLLQKLQKKVHGEPQEADTSALSREISLSHPEMLESSTRPSTRDTNLPTDTSSTLSSPLDEVENRSSSNEKSTSTQARPPLERRLSSAVENFKESFRTTLHPPKWNWKRYDREDEILAGFTERMTRMWTRARSGMYHEDVGELEDAGEPSTYRRRRAPTNESERYDYYRARNPEVNDLHPPVVSQLPATRADAAWMLLPPPSAAVMEASTRPGAEPEMRWPLCVVGRPPENMDPKPSLAKTLSTEQIASRDFVHSNDAEDEYNDVDGRSESVHSSEDRPENQSPARIKHLSDPIVKPPPIYPASRIAGELFVPKRREAWQVHYVVPSAHPISRYSGELA